MSSVVLDASAILALILEERGSEELPDETQTILVSSVNLAEVHGKLILNGWTADQAWEDARGCADRIEPLSAEQARLAGTLIASTRPFGLSLGDRCCLALALSSGSPVYTADRIWRSLDLGIPIHVIR